MSAKNDALSAPPKRNFGGETLTRFASRVTEIPGVAEFRVAHARN